MSNIDVPFSVSFTHRLRRTEDLAGDDFETLASLLHADDGQSAKVQLWIDSSLQSNDSDHESSAERLFNRLHRDGRIELAGPMHVIPGGESCKNSEVALQELLGLINEHDMDRRSYLIVAGGGAVLDVAGYAAAIAHRGIRLIRLPSTTLAQADSGVGVKNAINFFGKKNWVGTFAVPWAVINDAKLIETLPDRDFHSGLTEAVKVALLKDADFFDFLCRHADALHRRDSEISGEAISRSCRLHLDHITLGGDPFEALEARPLDFGHWSAHRLEPMTDYSLRHGEAVGIGVALDTLYSVAKFGFPQSDADRVCSTLRTIGTPLWCDALDSADEMMRGLEEFRQHLGGRLTVTMLPKVGSSIHVHDIDREVMMRSIEKLHQIATSNRNLQGEG